MTKATLAVKCLYLGASGKTAFRKGVPKYLILSIALLVMQTASGAARGKLCNRDCACFKGKLPLPTLTKRARSLQDPEQLQN